MWDQFYNFLYCFVCDQSENYKNGSAGKCTFKFISWKLTNKSHSCFLLMIGKQCGNKLGKQGNFV